MPDVTTTPTTAPTQSEATTHEVMTLALAFVAQMKHTAFTHFAAVGLTPAQAQTLRCLENLHSQRELAGYLQCDASNVTGIVDRLEAMGLAERHVSPSDRRVRQVSLTEAGTRLRNDLYREIVEASPISKLTASEREVFATLLHKILDPQVVQTARDFFG